MSERSNKELLLDIYESIEKILKYTNNISFDEFSLDDKTIDAVVRNFQIIGEAANRIQKKFRENHQEVEWRRIIGLRNRIVHEYFGINIEVIWTIIKTKLTDFKSQIGNLLEIN
jgi:uncharacterized protein with HEPN domain